MDQILKKLFGITKAVLQFEETIVFYDLTNTYYHGKKKGKLLSHGRSKEKRSDCPLVTLALTLDGSGFPRNVQILPGNAGEPATLKEAIEKLNGATPTVIMDSGIATEQNLQYLKGQGLDWITVERSKAPPVPENKPDQQFTTAGGVKIKAWKITKKEKDVEDVEDEKDVEDNAELRVFVHSEAKQAKEDQILETQCKKFVKALTTLHEGLSKPGYLKNYEKVTIKVGRLKEKYKKVSHLYEVEVSKKEGTKHAESVTVARRASHARRTQASGGYVLRTSHTGWSVETVARTYWRLTEIERTFRVMKSDLGLRPIYHSRDDRIEGHLFITVLAYHAAHLVRTRLKEHGIHDSWATIRDKLNRIRRITTKMVKNQYRYLITEVDQDLPPSMVQFFAVLGYVYDPDATRTVTEHVEEVSAPVSQKPPDS